MYNENMKSLSIYYKTLYEEILNHNSKENYSLVKNRNDQLNLLISDKTLIHSKYDPIRETRAWIDNIELEEEDTIIIFGLGLGYYIEFLIDKYPRKKIIIIEPDLDIFVNSLSCKDYSKYFYDENIVFIVNKDKYSVKYLIEKYIEDGKIRLIYTTHLPIYMNLYGEYISELYKEIGDLVKNIRINLSTKVLYSKRWVYNSFRNLKSISEYSFVDSLKEELKGVPIVIVSAGSSLEKNVDYLNLIKDKALIIAVGSAATILEHYNIAPHIIIAIDGSLGEGIIIKNLRNHTPLLIHNIRVYYECLKDYSGNKAWMSLENDKYTEGILKDLNIKTNSFISGGSVANLALDFSVWMESKVIIFIGQDLCYTKDKLYAEGTMYQQELQKENINKNQYIELTDINGNKVLSKENLIGYKNWFEEYIEVKEIKNGVYNCTEGGLAIKGIPNINFKETIDRLLTENYDIENKIKKFYSKPICIEKDKVISILDKYKNQIDRSLKISADRISELITLFNSEETYDFNIKFDYISRNNKEFEETDFYKYFIKNATEDFTKAITTKTQSELGKTNDINRKRKILLESLIKKYKNINETIELSKIAIEGRDVTGLF